MKKIFVTVAGLLAIALAVPAVAGPNWAIIREAQKAHQHQHNSQNNQTEEEVLPTDHGPHALSTPWLNKKREQELAAEAHNKKSSLFAAHSLFNSSTHG